ncbi:hypothetical protein [Roseixanthobacter liquoris]
MRRILQIALVVGLGLGLAGCDKCGDWFKVTPTHACSAEPLPK